MGQSGPGGQHQGGLTSTTPPNNSVSPIGESQRPYVQFGSKGEELTVRPAAPWTPVVLIFSIPAIVVAFISSTHEDFTLGEVCVISAFMGTSSAFPVTGRVIGASFQRPKRSKV